ncbi:MAG: hypothetical protein M3070_07705 [Actinomycetota bacterium]|nr:hypothetical protein [Actinomycetota bacterium]
MDTIDEENGDVRKRDGGGAASGGRDHRQLSKHFAGHKNAQRRGISRWGGHPDRDLAVLSR